MRAKMLTEPKGYDLFLRGKKQATSRYGDRKEEFVVGNIYDFECNDGSGRSSPIVVTKVDYRPLVKISAMQALDIGCDSIEDAIIQFTSIYTKLGREVDQHTWITVVYFMAVNV